MIHDAKTRKRRKAVERTSRRGVVLSPVLAILVICTVSCTNETNGLPTASSDLATSSRPTIPGAGNGTSSKPTSTSSNATSPVKDLDPCTLITAAEASGLGVIPGTRKDSSSGTSRRCVWTAPDAFTMDVSTFDTRGVKDVVASGEIKKVPTIGRHEAVQSFGGVDSCAISIAITETSRVDTSAAAHGNAAKSCEVAMQVAKLVEPKLPGGS